MKLKVQDVYTEDVVTIAPDASAPEASKLMQQHRVRRLPVVQGDRLVGIVALSDLMKASPSSATSLSVWELNYLADKVKVQEIMSEDVVTVSVDTNLRDVGRLMLDRKIGGIPVVRGDEVIGIVTESDIFRTFVDLLDE